MWSGRKSQWVVLSGLSWCVRELVSGWSFRTIVGSWGTWIAPVRLLMFSLLPNHTLPSWYICPASCAVSFVRGTPGDVRLRHLLPQIIWCHDQFGDLVLVVWNSSSLKDTVRCTGTGWVEKKKERGGIDPCQFHLIVFYFSSVKSYTHRDRKPRASPIIARWSRFSSSHDEKVYYAARDLELTEFVEQLWFYSFISLE